MQEAYTYRNLPIPGGGYVTGFLFHEKKPAVLYLRTDIGGTYRFCADRQRWESLIDHVTMEDLRETFPIAAALDPRDPDMLFIACGIWNEPPGKLCVSRDGGATFTYYDMPMRVHGNLNGRGTGYRLIVDQTDGNRLYFASQADGLWTSHDRGASWSKLTAMKEEYLTFVGQSADGRALIVGSAGVTTKRGEALRGKSLYVSYDDGESFFELWQPDDGKIDGVKLSGLVAQRYAWDRHYLYVTFSVMGQNAYVTELGYSCDGGSVIGGKVVRYPIDRGGMIGHGDDITPKIFCGGGANMFDTAEREKRETDDRETVWQASGILPYGFSGISCTMSKPGLVVVSTISKEDGDCILRSFDFGQHWEVILYDLSIGTMEFRTSYMKPEYNGGHNIIHWLTDLKINPFDCEEMWFNTGTGVFRTKNLCDDNVVFSDRCDGLEETVHLNLYSPPSGEVQLIDILGDLGGFAFRDIDKPCDNSFADENGNRYITCINADYAERDPNTVIVTPRGNWTGKTKGGLILSKDQCRTFTRLSMPYGISEKIDRALREIEYPNVNSGWAAISPDGEKIVWSIADGIFLPADMILTSTDGGKSFQKAAVYDIDGNCISDCSTGYGMKVFSDRVDPDLFYGFGRHFEFYVSCDGGATFREKEIVRNDPGEAFLQEESAGKASREASRQQETAGKASGEVSRQQETAGKASDEASRQKTSAGDIPPADFTIIDTANKTEVRGDSARSGRFYMALREHGLFRLDYDKKTQKATLKKLSKDGDTFYRLGLGLPYEGADYATCKKALYVAAAIDGTYGFYRTADEGQTFVRLNTDAQMFGEINSIEGDSRTYGRFYIATGSRGVLYGEPTEVMTNRREHHAF